jgi:hypothetical protein
MGEYVALLDDWRDFSVRVGGAAREQEPRNRGGEANRFMDEARMRQDSQIESRRVARRRQQRESQPIEIELTHAPVHSNNVTALRGSVLAAAATMNINSTVITRTEGATTTLRGNVNRVNTGREEGATTRRDSVARASSITFGGRAAHRRDIGARSSRFTPSMPRREGEISTARNSQWHTRLLTVPQRRPVGPNGDGHTLSMPSIFGERSTSDMNGREIGRMRGSDDAEPAARRTSTFNWPSEREIMGQLVGDSAMRTSGRDDADIDDGDRRAQIRPTSGGTLNDFMAAYRSGRARNDDGENVSERNVTRHAEPRDRRTTRILSEAADSFRGMRDWNIRIEDGPPPLYEDASSDDETPPDFYAMDDSDY